MAINIVAITGPHAGQRFAVKPGFKVGRQKVEIRLDDPKVSTQHAEVVAEGEQLLLKDLDSKNGLFIHGQKVEQVHLFPGAVFQLGSGDFEVEQTSEATPLVSSSSTILPIIEKPSALSDFLQIVLEQIEDKPRVLVPIHPPLQLTFIAGLQVEVVWWIGYGPRTCGTESVDLTLHEPEAPALCFEIIPTPRGLSLKTQHSDVVQVNGRSVKTHVLKAGDVISILNSKLEVSYDL